VIFGIGTDIVRVARMQRDIERFGEKFAERILTESELVEYRQTAQRAHFLAKRFAAKEAAAKALGTGFAHGIQLRQIAVTHDANGKPLLEFSGAALAFIERHGIRVGHLSLADEADHAVAFVALETA
jgi:holo-[acyl-carrier protein] synthase